MNETVRPEVSKNNEYWISRHRYYELKHFCQQYPEWKSAMAWLDGLQAMPTEKIKSGIGDPTANTAILRSFYSDRIDMVDCAAEEADPELAYYIRKGATEGYSYEALKINFNLPCCRNVYYDRYRKFFWILHNSRK